MCHPPRRKYAILHGPYPIVKTDSVNFSIYTVRLKLGIIFPREMPTLPGGQITSVSPTISEGENQIFSGTARISHYSGEILLAGNHSHFFRGGGGGKLLLEWAERPLYSQFSYSQIPGGKGGKLVYQWGKISYIEVFPTPGIPIFPGGGDSTSGKS